MADRGSDRYGVSNLEYDLIATLSNLLQGQEALQKYLQDAQQAGDQGCAELFQTLMDNNRNAAQHARRHLQRHMSGGQ